MTRLRAAIAGAGLGGLYAAAALASEGVEVVVCERADALGEVGAGIQISPNGAKLLRRIGALREVEREAFMPEAAELRLGRSGATVLHMPLGAVAEARWGAPYLQAHRADLLAALLHAARAAGAEIRLGAATVGVESGERSASLQFEDGSHVEADVVIGADGVRSVVREAIFGPVDTRFLGAVAWRATVPAEALPPGLVHPTATVWAGPRRHVVTYYLRRGTLVNVVAVEERAEAEVEDWRVEGDPDAMRAAFAGWREGVTGVLDRVERCMVWGLFDRPAPRRWREGRVALLGDACHPMLPYMAQGAVQSFEDGAALAAVIGGAEPAEVPSALERYEARRRNRAERVQEAARANGRLFHAANPIARAAIFGPIAFGARLAPSLALRRFDWLYGHEEAA